MTISSRPIDMIEYENLNKVNRPFEREFKDSFESFLQNGWYVLGEQVRLFEEEFAAYYGSKYCIGLASGLDALYCSLKILELPACSEVIVPSNTYIATILAIVNAGLQPVLVEPKPDTYNIDPDLIAEHLSERTKAILVVHLYGNLCEMDKISSLSEQYGLTLIEDCAQAHGAEFQGKKAGTFGLFGAFSFYPTKNLGALGDGGALITDNEELALKLRAMRNYGSKRKYHNQYIGINSRLDELQAGFLRIKLRSLDSINTHKTKLAALYSDLIKHPDIILPRPEKDSLPSYHIFNIRCSNRDELRSFLLENGIGTEVHYPVPPHHQEAYRGIFSNTYFPRSEEIHTTTLSLPVSSFHTEEEVRYISEVINRFECR